MRKKQEKRKAVTVDVDYQNLAPVIARALDKFVGDFTLFERAVGALVVGQFVGWEVLRIVHDGGTYKKYEDVFAAGTPGFKFKDYCPERRGPLAYRSVGLTVADTVSDAWDTIRKSLTSQERKSVSPLS